MTAAMTRNSAELIASHLAKARDREWWFALFAAAFDETHDAAEACEMADAAANPAFGEPKRTSPFGKSMLKKNLDDEP